MTLVMSIVIVPLPLSPVGGFQRLPHLQGEAEDLHPLSALWSGVPAGSWLGGHRRRHQLHQQLQPVCHADCR